MKGIYEMWNKNDKSHEPDIDKIIKYINNPLWSKFYSYMIERFQSKPKIEYSGCSMQPGWNIKFKKGGKSLCTVYPMEGNFITMVVIGEKEANEVHFSLPFFTEYVKNLYHTTNPGKNSKWLMIEIQDENVLNDAFRLMEIRRNCK